MSKSNWFGTPGELPPDLELLQLIVGKWASQAVYAAAELFGPVGSAVPAPRRVPRVAQSGAPSPRQLVPRWSLLAFGRKRKPPRSARPKRRISSSPSSRSSETRSSIGSAVAPGYSRTARRIAKSVTNQQS